MADADGEADDEGDELAACATIALFTIELAADKALAKFGRDPLDEGAKTAASGEEAAAETTLEAKFEPEAVPTGLVWM